MGSICKFLFGTVGVRRCCRMIFVLCTLRNIQTIGVEEITGRIYAGCHSSMLTLISEFDYCVLVVT